MICAERCAVVHSSMAATHLNLYSHTTTQLLSVGLQRVGSGRTLTHTPQLHSVGGGRTLTHTPQLHSVGSGRTLTHTHNTASVCGVTECGKWKNPHPHPQHRFCLWGYRVWEVDEPSATLALEHGDQYNQLPTDGWLIIIWVRWRLDSFMVQMRDRRVWGVHGCGGVMTEYTYSSLVKSSGLRVGKQLLNPEQL